MMIIKDRLLFLKYALPCACTLVKRGKILQSEVDRAVRLVAAGKVPEKGFEKECQIHQELSKTFHNIFVVSGDRPMAEVSEVIVRKLNKFFVGK